MRERGGEECRKKEAGHGQLSLRFFLLFVVCCVLFCFVVTKDTISFHAAVVNQLLFAGIYAKQEVNKHICMHIVITVL